MRELDQLEARKLAFYTSNLVVAETHALVLRGMGSDAALKVTERILTDSATTVLQVERVHEQAILRLLRRYYDKTFSFTDASSFVLMQERGIDLAFAFDQHFRQFGGSFQVIPART